ncbi:MAG: amidohydrolase family protein [Pseudolabrys sp.]
MIIDMHSHFVPKALLDDVVKRKAFPSVQASIDDKGGVSFAFAGKKPTRPVMPGMSDMAKREEWMAAQRIDKQVVAAWMDMTAYELPAEEGADWSRYLNHHMLKAVADRPELIPLATVPLQSGKLAARVLEEAMDAGFHGLMIGTQPKGLGGALDTANLEPFWEAASARNTPIILHPMFATGDDRLGDFGLINAVGRITDTTHAVARLLYSGHLTRYPGVKLVLSHGGAAIPFIMGRLKRSYESERTPGDPAEGFKKLYFDTIVFDPQALRFVCQAAGNEKVMMGSDYPFSVGDLEPLKIVEASKFGKKEHDAITGGTAAELFNIKA